MQNIQIELEARNCRSCGRVYKCVHTSKQRFCSRMCESSGVKWGGRQKASKDVKKPTVSASVDFGRLARSFDKPRTEGSESTGLRTPRPSARAVQDTTGKTGTRTLSVAPPTPEITESASEPHKGNGMKSTESQSSLENVSEKTAVTLPEVYTGLSPNLDLEISQSMNLLKSTGELLFSAMKGTVNQEADTSVRLHDVDRLRALAELGKQIIGTMRTGHDIIKLANDLRQK